MRKQHIFIAAYYSFLFAGCSFNGGVKKDLTTGLTASYAGFAVNDVKLVTPQGIALTDNTVSLDSSFAIAVFGVRHFQLIDGKAYPGCELTIKDTPGKIIAHAADVLAAFTKDGIATKDAVDLAATIRMSKPLIVGEKYHITARFFDKQNSKNELLAEVNVVLH